MIKKSEKKTLTPKMTDVLVRPIITEKAMKAGESSQVVFEVKKSATNPEIKAAVEGVFGVEVKAVNTLTQKGKIKFFRGQKGVRSDVKKAIVTWAKGQTIDVTAGV